MIQLHHHDCPADIIDKLRAARDNFGARSACVWVAGEGPWDRFLERMPGQETHYTVYFTNGTYQHLDVRRIYGAENAHLQTMRLGVSAIIQAHKPMPGTPRNCAVILRPNAYLVLFPETEERSLYVSMPGLTAHEQLADIASLEQDYPGQFRVN